jgi:hypothetical protein
MTALLVLGTAVAPGVFVVLTPSAVGAGVPEFTITITNDYLPAATAGRSYPQGHTNHLKSDRTGHIRPRNL